MKKIGKDEIIPVLFLTIVVCVSVILLSLTDIMTRDIIEEQKRLEVERTLKEHFPDLTDFEYDEKIEVYSIFIVSFLFSLDIEYNLNMSEGQVDENLKAAFEEKDSTLSDESQLHIIDEKSWEIIDGSTTYRIEDTDTELSISEVDTIGYAFMAEGKGYGGTIEILVSLKGDKNSINSISIINHMETPGLGAKTAESDFTDRFKGVAITDVKLSKDGGKIDALTGATISSTAVVKAVREAASQKVKLIEEREDNR